MTAGTEDGPDAVVTPVPVPGAVPPPASSPSPRAETAAGGARGTNPVTGWLRRPDITRRGFLRTGSIGVIAAGLAGSVPGLSSLVTSAEPDAPEIGGGAAAAAAGTAPAASADVSGVVQSFSARVSNLSTGEMRLFVGNQTMSIQDPELAQRLNQAVRAAQSAGR